MPPFGRIKVAQGQATGGRQPYRILAGHSLLLRRRLEFDDQLGRYPSAVLDLDTPGLGPLANSRGVGSGSTNSPTSGSAWPSSRRSGRPAGGTDVWLQCLSQGTRMLGAQVDLIVRTIEPEADGALGLVAVQVINEQRLYLLRYVYATPRMVDASG